MTRFCGPLQRCISMKLADFYPLGMTEAVMGGVRGEGACEGAGEIECKFECWVKTINLG